MKKSNLNVTQEVTKKVEKFIEEVEGNDPVTIYTYLAQFNNNQTVTDVYSIINQPTPTYLNAILPSCYETYFLTQPISLENLESITVFYLDHSCAGNACLSTIQFYVSETETVNINGSINYYTLQSSAPLPNCQSTGYPTTTYSSGCADAFYTQTTIQSTDEAGAGGWSTFTGYNYLILVERVAYPVAASSGVCSYPIIAPTQPTNYNMTYNQTDSPYKQYSRQTAYTVNFSVFATQSQ